MDIKDMIEKKGDRSKELKVIGAGLSRTGTLSTRAALEELLGGACYHGVVPVVERREHLPLWSAAISSGKLTQSTHCQLLQDYSAGVDYPFNLFWRQLLDLHPSAKVVLTVRDHKKLFRSLSNIFGLYSEGQRWPQSWLNRVLGTPFPFLKMEGTWKSPRLGLNLYEAVLAGETEAITFFEDWEASVMEAVPPNRLLVFRVQEGWKPLAAFLGLPEPTHPFPNVNDTAQINMIAFTVRIVAWIVVVLLPLLLIGLLLQSSASSPTLPGLATSMMLMVAGIALARVYVNSTLKAHVAQKGKKDD